VCTERREAAAWISSACTACELRSMLFELRFPTRIVRV
jgi:hypothetical protein